LDLVVPKNQDIFLVNELGAFGSQMLHGAGIFTNMYPKNQPNVGKYTIHGAYGV
jgi:hypothetical protein